MQQPMRDRFFERLENVQRRRPELVLGSVIVDGDADVVFPDELLKPWQRFGSRISGDYYADAGALTVLELGRMSASSSLAK